MEALPGELAGLAHEVTVNYPWGSLLRGLLEPRADAARAVRSLCRVGAELRITTSVDPVRDAAMLEGLPVCFLDAAHHERLAAEFAAAGFEMCAITELAAADARAVGTAWARKLAAGRARRTWLLTFLAAEAQGAAERP